MINDEYSVSYTASELNDMVRRGESNTDWARVEALTDEEIEASIDHEDEGTFDWSTIRAWPPRSNDVATMDPEVLEWFQAQGPGYQTRINTVLRTYVEAQRNREAS